MSWRLLSGLYAVLMLAALYAVPMTVLIWHFPFVGFPVLFVTVPFVGWAIANFLDWYWD